MDLNDSVSIRELNFSTLCKFIALAGTLSVSVTLCSVMCLGWTLKCDRAVTVGALGTTVSRCERPGKLSPAFSSKFYKIKTLSTDLAEVSWAQKDRVSLLLVDNPHHRAVLKFKNSDLILPSALLPKPARRSFIHWPQPLPTGCFCYPIKKTMKLHEKPKVIHLRGPAHSTR